MLKRPIRVAIWGNVKLGYSWFVLMATEGAYRNGCRVMGVDLKSSSMDFIASQMKSFRPDLIFTHILFHKQVDTSGLLDLLRKLRGQGSRVCYHMGDARLQPRYPHALNDSVDLGLVNNFNPPVLTSFSEIWKVPCIWWPYACLYQKELASPVEELRFNGLVFTGNMGNGSLYQRRTNFVKELRIKLPVLVYETQSDNDVRHLTPELSASVKGVLGLPADNDVPGYLDVRPFQYLGAGALLYQRKVEGIEKVFRPDIHLRLFEGYNLDKFKSVFQKFEAEGKNEDIRMSAFDHVQKYHSAEKRVKDVIDYFYG